MKREAPVDSQPHRWVHTPHALLCVWRLQPCVCGINGLSQHVIMCACVCRTIPSTCRCGCRIRRLCGFATSKRTAISTPLSLVPTGVTGLIAGSLRGATGGAPEAQQRDTRSKHTPAVQCTTVEKTSQGKGCAGGICVVHGAITIAIAKGNVANVYT